MDWFLSDRCDPVARRLADRHYNRQSIGAPNFVPPGRCLVLSIPGAAFWVTSWPFAEYVRHRWAGAMVCSAFRNERPDLYKSSDLIAQALRATAWRYGEIPDLGMVTFVNADKVRHKRDPGRCFVLAGFKHDGETAGGLIALQLLPSAWPAAEAPLVQQQQLQLA